MWPYTDRPSAPQAYQSKITQSAGMATQMQLKILFLKEITWPHGRLERKTTTNWTSFWTTTNEISFWNKMFLCSIKNGNVYCWWIVIESPPVNAKNCKLYNAISKRLSDGFARRLSAICSSLMRWNEWKVRPLYTVKTPLVFLEYIFQFFMNLRFFFCSSHHLHSMLQE